MNRLLSVDHCSELDIIGHDLEPHAGYVAEQCKRLIGRYVDVHENVVAGIVMTRSDQLAQFVSVGMGKNFIRKENLTCDGTRVLDCHAEVLAKRGLKRYILRQILSAKHGEESIATDLGGCKYAIDSDVKFHLYISKAPCGGAALPFGCNSESHLRYRKDGGEGNVLRIEPGCFYKSCCSDKIALWNVVGVQGALLGQLLTEPVFFSSIILENTCVESARMAFYGRLGLLGFPCHRPTVITISSGHVPSPKKKSPNHNAFCWASTDKTGEFLNTATGLRSCYYGTDHSTDVSKRATFQLWSEIMDGFHESTYLECKTSAVEYQRKKKQFYSLFIEHGMGELFRKPPQVNNFCLQPPSFQYAML